MAKTITVELNPNVEINDAANFNMYAIALGVPVRDRGQKPKSALVRAILADERFTLVDTDYLNKGHADAGSTGPTDYGVKLKALQATRDELIETARAEFVAARTALRAEYNVADGEEKTPSRSSSGGYVVSARIPQRDSNGEPKRTNDGSKVRFRPGKSKVELSMADIRANSPAGERGRPSHSHILHAAAVVGEWLPKGMLTANGWESVLLKDVEVTHMDSPESSVAA